MAEAGREPRRRRRRSRWMLGIPAGLVLLAVLLVSPFLLIRHEGIRVWVLSRSIEGQVLAPGQRIRIDEIVRLDPQRFDFRGVSVERQGEAGWVPWLEVERIAAEWNVRKLFGRKVDVRFLEIESPRLDWLEVPDPLFAPRERDESRPRVPSFEPPRLPSLRCETLTIDSALVLRAGQPWITGSLALADLEHEGGRVSGTLASGLVRSIPDSLDLSLADGEVEGVLIEQFTVDSLGLWGPGIEARLFAKLDIARADSTRLHLNGHLELIEVDPQEIPHVDQLGLPLESGDRVAGRCDFAGALAPGRDPEADLVLGLSGRALGTPLDTLRILASATPARAELLDLEFRHGSLHVVGEGVWAPSARWARVHARFDGLDLAGPPVSRLVAGLPPSDFAGSVEGEADSLGPNLRFHGDVRIVPGTLSTRPTPGFSAQVAIDPEQFRLDTLWVNTDSVPALTASGSLQRRGARDLAAVGLVRDFPLGPWVDPWLDVGLEGNTNGTFRFSGTIENPRVDADLGVVRGKVEGIRIDSLVVATRGGTIRDLRLETSLRAQGLDFYGFEVDSLRAETIVADTIGMTVVAHRDSALILMNGRVTPTDPGFAWIDRIRIEPGRAPSVETLEPFTLGFSAQRVWIDSVAVRSAAGTAWGSGWVLPRPGQSGKEPFAFAIGARDLDLGAIARFFGADSDTLNGTASLTWKGEGVVDSPRYAATLEARTTETWGWLWETIGLSIRAGDLETGAGVEIDSLHAVAHGYVGPLPVIGTEPMGPEPPGDPVEVTSRRLAVHLAAPWKASIDTLASGAWTEVALPAGLDGSLSVRNLPLAPLVAPVLAPQAKRTTSATFATEPVNPMLSVIRIERPEAEAFGPSALGGEVGFDLDLEGRGSAPIVKVVGAAEDVQVYQAHADSVAFQAHYDDAALTVERVDWRQGERGFHAQGTIPLRLSADPASTRLLDAPMHLEAQVPSVDLSLVSLFTTLVADPSGNLIGQVAIDGPPDRLRFAGDFVVNNGAFRIPLREERVTGLEARLHLDSLGVHIEEAEGRWNREGTVRASGWYRDPDHFQLRGEVRDGPVFESGNYNFLADADLRAEPVAAGDSLRPRLSGTVRVHEGTITMNLARPGRQSVLVTPWIFDIDVIVPGNVRVIQPGSSANVGNGRIQAHYDMPYWSLGGQIDVLSGHILVFNKNLRIRSGTVEFLDTGTGPYPVLDIIAETQVPNPETDGQPIQIEVHIQGSPLPDEGLEITLESPNQSQYSQEDLVDLLTVGQLRSGSLATLQAGDPARAYVTGQFVTQLERELVSEAPWLDIVEISGGTAETDPVTISLRAVTEPQWSLRYSQELASTSGQEVSLNYRLSNLLFLNAAADRRVEAGVPAETYSLDLRFRLDY